MNILIEAPFKISEDDKNIIRSKIQYLNRYQNRIIQINVFFKSDGSPRRNEIVAEIRVLVPGQHLFAESTDPDAMKAFSRAYSAIKRRVKQHRNKMREHQSPIRQMNEMAGN